MAAHPTPGGYGSTRPSAFAARGLALRHSQGTFGICFSRMTYGPVVHVRRARITNIRSISELTWDVEQHATGADLAGWHVIVGDNGSGKSSVLQAIALALEKNHGVHWEQQALGSWLRQGCTQGSIGIRLERHPNYDWYHSAVFAPTPGAESLLDAEVRFTRTGSGIVVESSSERSTYDPREHIWSGLLGWFSAWYGPHRQSSSDTTELRGLKLKARGIGSSGFVDSEKEAWLRQRLFGFINASGLLPHDTRIVDAGSTDLLFVVSQGHKMPIEDMSNGYQSLVCLALGLLRDLVAVFGADRVFDHTGTVAVPGVVLIDEIDAHLHPQWQRRIGQWFLKRFPRVQFIVTTHSPLVCQAAERGTIYRLPPPGSGEAGGFVSGVDRDRLLYGTVLDAYETESFGEVPTRSDSGQEKLERLAQLNLEARRAPLGPEQEAEREHLRTVLPTLGRGERLP